MAARRRTLNEKVSFRLDDYHAGLLAKGAAEVRSAGTTALSAGEYARQLVMEALTDARHQQLLHELKDVRSEIGVLRKHLRAVAVQLLCDAADIEPEEAEAWAAKRLR